MLKHSDLANVIRFLSADIIEKAKSGHPGAPLGMADMATVLWREFLSHNPKNPNWWNRDRFVLSNGHGSALIYSLLHLAGYDLSIEDLKNFRQLGSKTPGHPEFGHTPGVEVTTGPLGQGIGMAVGFALAEWLLASEFNEQGLDIIDHYTYVFMGDGCLMEGVSHEVCSLAGTLKLNKLIAFWDDNGISIDGDVKGWFTEDVPTRFRSYGWNVIDGIDGHNPEEIREAILNAKQKSNKPTLICCKTIIGKGAPTKSNSAGCHGSPLGEEEIKSMRAALNWNSDAFIVPGDIKKAWDQVSKGESAEKLWQGKLLEYSKLYPAKYESLKSRMEGQLPSSLNNILDSYAKSLQSEQKTIATRVASQQVLNQIASSLPTLLGGSADLSPSVGTKWQGSSNISPSNPCGRYISYGVREFGMGCIMNGLARHGGFLPYGGTFLVFSDYAKNAIRLSSIMSQQVIWVLTHDSIMMGEDGPTHQPIEQLAMLRLTPKVRVWRPADSVETSIAWKSSLNYKTGPSCLALSRQNLPVLPKESSDLANIEKGGYVIHKGSDHPDAIIIATGSEVALALEAVKSEMLSGITVRVVSMPCPEVFLEQSKSYIESVLPSDVKSRLAIEAAASLYWYRFVGFEGKVIGLDRFGDSAPGHVLYEHFGFTVKNVAECVLDLVKKD